MAGSDKVTHPRNPVPLVDRLAYVVREYEESHASYAPLVVRGRTIPKPTAEVPDPEPYAPVKTECQCQQCKDARVVLADYDAEGVSVEDYVDRVR